MFASRSIFEHLIRGVLGVAAIAIAVSQSSLLVGLLALPVALFAFRGCPSCWLIGFFETLAARKTGDVLAKRCQDGTCRQPVKSS